MNKLQKIRQMVSYLLSSANSGVYSGFVGHDNLGDEVLFQAIRGAFNPYPLSYLPYLPPTQNRFSRWMIESRHHHLGVLGGGTLIGANLKDGRNPFRENFQAVLDSVDRAVVFGTGVGALSDVSSENQWLLEWKPLLAKCDVIGVRGPESVRSLASIGLQVELLGDPACLLTQGHEFWTPNEKTLGVNICHLRGQNSHLEQLILDHIAKMIASKIKEGWSVSFFIVAPGDRHLVAKIAEKVGISKPIIYCIYQSATPYLNAVRSMNAFIGIKLHSVILAMCAGVPSIMIEYAPKCRDFMMSIGMQAFNININELTYEKLETCLDQILLSQNKIAFDITTRMLNMREKQLRKALEIKLATGLILDK